MVFFDDAALAAAIQGVFSGPFGTPFFIFCARWLPIALAAVSCVAALVEREPNHRHAWKELFWSVGLAFAGSLVLAWAFHRVRPFQAPGGFVQALVPPPASTYSFPSTHAAVMWAWAVGACRVFRPAAFVWIACAVLVSLARVVVGVHYFTDVAAGALVGVAAWEAVRLGHRRLRRPEPAV